jgi:hypothetical protein
MIRFKRGNNTEVPFTHYAQGLLPSVNHQVLQVEEHNKPTYQAITLSGTYSGTIHMLDLMKEHQVEVSVQMYSLL